MYYILFFVLVPSVSKICLLATAIELKIWNFLSKGLIVDYDKFVSVRDDGSIWKKIIKMWERNFVLWQITFLTWEKISQDR